MREAGWVEPCQWGGKAERYSQGLRDGTGKESRGMHGFRAFFLSDGPHLLCCVLKFPSDISVLLNLEMITVQMEGL